MSSYDTIQAGLFKQNQTVLPSVITTTLATPTLLVNTPSSTEQGTREEHRSTAHQSDVPLDQGLNTVDAGSTDRHNTVTSTGEQTPNESQSQVSTRELQAEDGLSSQQDPRLSDRLPCAGEIDPLVELTWSGVLRLMIGSLPPTIVIKLLSSCQGDRFGICEQLHTLLSQLTHIQTKQR